MLNSTNGKLFTYNPAGHRIFGLANPSLEHTKPECGKESKMRDCVAEYMKILEHTHEQIILTRRTNNRISQTITWTVISNGTI